MRLPWQWPLAILAGALGLRLILFTGIQGTDDLLYAARAHALTDGRFVAGADVFAARLGHVVPIAVCFSLFGVHAWSLVIPSLIGSLILVGLALRLGRELYDETTGRVAGALVALLPLDVFYATEGHPDLLQAALGSLGLYLLWSSIHEPGGRRGLRVALLAGAVFGLAHLTKETAFIFLIPALLWLKDRAARPRVAAAIGVFAGTIGLELLLYGVLKHDPLWRVHLAAGQVDAIRIAGDSGFWRRALDLLGTLLDPRGAGFAFLGILAWCSLAGVGWVVRRDCARSGWLVLWLVSSVLFVAFWPLTLSPYRPALTLFPRFFAAAALPAALLSARFFVEGLLKARPGIAWGAAAAVSLLSLVCAVQVHQDGVRWRRGAEWAWTKLENEKSAPVVTDQRTMSMLLFLSGYKLQYDLRAYHSDDPPPVGGTVLLDNERWVAAVESWDSIPPPPWWRATLPARTKEAEEVVPARGRLRGARGPDEHVVFWKIDYSPR